MTATARPQYLTDEARAGSQPTRGSTFLGRQAAQPALKLVADEIAAMQAEFASWERASHSTNFD